MAKYWWRLRKVLAQKVLHTDDTPHAIALGTGIAMLVAFLPLIGLQTIISVAIAALFRANKAVCLPIVWITNPFTAVPVYGACFGLGRFVMSGTIAPNEVAVLAELELQQQAGIFELAFWQNLFTRLVSYGLELWVGCIIVGVVLGVVSYFLSRWGVTTYRERRRQRMLRRTLLRSKLKPGEVTRRTEPA